MAAVAVLRNDTLQAFLQVRQNFQISLKMSLVKRDARRSCNAEKRGLFDLFECL